MNDDNTKHLADNFPFVTVFRKRVPYYEAMTIKQERYIKKICHYMDIDIPNIATKEDACEWLERYVPIYQRQLIIDEAHMIAFHEDAGDRI